MAIWRKYYLTKIMRVEDCKSSQCDITHKYKAMAQEMGKVYRPITARQMRCEIIFIRSAAAASCAQPVAEYLLRNA